MPRRPRDGAECFAEDWRERTGVIDELGEVLGDCGDIKTEHWDRLRGLLRSEGWREALRIRGLIEDLPGLSRMIRRPQAALCRARSANSCRPAAATASSAPARRAANRAAPGARPAGETRSVHRADRIARMLPAEALMLGHPRLRLVWHARPRRAHPAVLRGRRPPARDPAAPAPPSAIPRPADAASRPGRC